MAGLRKGIQVTNEFDGYEPPEDTRAYGDAYADDSRMMMAEPEVAYTMEDEDEEKREALNSAKKEPSRRTMSDVAGASSGAEGNLDYATGGSPARRTMSDVAGASSGAERNLDSATGGSPAPAAAPAWWNGKSINTTAFCKEFLENNELRCVNGTFFTPDGYCPADKLKRDIYNIIKNHVVSFPIQTAGNIVENLKAEASTDALMVDDDIINFANGTFNISNCRWTYEKFFCRNRLAAAYTNVAGKDPEHWVRFVNELLDPDDVLTLQEFMGYCLIPSTRAQKMLLIIGNGGEGKSRIGVVMRAVLGDNMNNGSIPKLESNSFARADLEHKLLMVDDDMRMQNLPTTNNLKALITAEGPMDLERKGVQSYQGLMYCRLMAFSNGFLRSANDDSYGFFRRQLILMTKPRPKDRVDDPFLSEKLIAERDMIVIWALAGLYRLREHNFQFTVSAKSRAAIRAAMDEANNIVSCLRSEGTFVFGPEYETSSKDLYWIYKCWCEDNAVETFDKLRVIGYLRAHAHEFGLTYALVKDNNGRVRGFKGISPASRLRTAE